MKFDHVLLIGFGAPTKEADLDPYLKRFAENLRIPAERLAEVRGHYVAIGGFSPYNAAVSDFGRRLGLELAANGHRLPIYTGMKYWNPFIPDTLSEIKRAGLRAGAALVLAPHRSQKSFGDYRDSVQAAADGKVSYQFVEPWHTAPDFIDAYAASAREAARAVAVPGPVRFIFCAHSIPESAAAESRYRQEIEESAAAIAGKLDLDQVYVAYHSQSARPGIPWMGPEVSEAIEAAALAGARAVVLVPIGFLCENAEILYDLDIEARGVAEERGLAYARAGTVLGNNRLVQFFARRIGEMNGNS